MPDNQRRCHGGNVNFAPAIGDRLIAVLYVKHGSREFFLFLHEQKFFHRRNRALICFHTRNAALSPGQDFQNVRVCVRVLFDQMQFAVDVGHKVFQRLINTGFRLASLDRNVFPVYIIFGAFNRLFQFRSCGFFIPVGFVLLSADNVLNGLRKLWKVVAPADIRLDLHGAFQRIIVMIAGQYHNGLSFGLCHQTQFGLVHFISRRRQKAEFHTVGQSARCNAVHHLVKVKVVSPILVFPAGINIAVDHAGNLSDNCRRVHVGITDFAGNVLFFIGQEMPGIFLRASDVILTVQAIQRFLNAFPQNDFLGANMIRH